MMLGSISTASIVQIVLLSLVISALGARTHARNSDYGNPLRLWTKNVEDHPGNWRAWFWLATEHTNLDKATGYRVVAEIEKRWPHDSRLQAGVAQIYFKQHSDLEGARRCFRRSAALDPSNTLVLVQLVWLLAGTSDETIRNGPEAFQIAKNLRAEFPDSAEILDLLGVAQAECGDFEGAIASAEAAIMKAKSRGLGTTYVEAHLARYRQHKPFRFDRPET